MGVVEVVGGTSLEVLLVGGVDLVAVLLLLLEAGIKAKAEGVGAGVAGMVAAGVGAGAPRCLALMVGR
jgi:hypothetical protein